MAYQLSICIPTLNRGTYIGDTLKSITSQLEEGVEIIIVDGGSSDNTSEIVQSFQRSFPDIHYVQNDASKTKPSNEGFARDCDHAVELAKGKFCWLMTDDDILVPGAIRTVLDRLGADYPLIVASVEVRNKDLSEVIVRCRPELPQDRTFYPSEWNQFAVTVGGCLTFVGAVIVKRQFWLSRNREKYYSSGFIHVGVIFDEPIKDPVLVIADPIVSVRHGNAQWTNRAFQIWLFNWPDLIWSLSTISKETKQLLAPEGGWGNLKTLLLLRALGSYSIREYRSFLSQRMHVGKRRILAKMIAHFPRSILFIPAYAYLRFKGPESAITLFDLKHSWLSK